MPVTLAIDYGSKYIGLALVRNEGGRNEPLFAGTLQYDSFILKKKVEPRAHIRRIRRTKKAKKTRLRRLKQGLEAAGIPAEKILPIVRFCRRRGYKSLWDKEEALSRDYREEGENLYRFSREDFFDALEKELERLLPTQQRALALEVCEKVLNRQGDRCLEIRPMRIENRGTSRCAWDGCTRVTPRRDNAIRDALAQFVFTVYKAPLTEHPSRQSEVKQMLDLLEVLAKRYRNAAGANVAAERKALMKKVGKELALLKELRPDGGDTNTEDAKKTWEHIRRNIKNLIIRQAGRNRYCREHSAQYVEYLLTGRPIPFKRTLTERDIVSRREEILFGKLWRYIEARVLPLAEGKIDRVVVERTAFDLLAGRRKQRQGLGDKAVEEMYQQGPRLGFKNDLEMLKKEFGGLCAYCGKPSGDLLEREHILPRFNFFFDSYINKVPACRTCNSSLKGKMLPGAAKLHIHDNVYKAYVDYLRERNSKKPPHLFHTIKKGILNLMRQADRVWEAEAYLGLIAKHFSEIVQTQRGPRPLTRFLCEKLRRHQGTIPDFAAYSGRHTEVWRRAAYPGFDKTSDKAGGNLVNHALDAMLLACDLPKVSALEARHLKTKSLVEWKAEVKSRAPTAGEGGIPVLPEPTNVVPGFEEVLAGNFVSSDLAMFNWNRKSCSTHRQELYGWSSRHDVPTKRNPAVELAADLAKIKKKDEVKKELEKIAHPSLKQYLIDAASGKKPGEEAVLALKSWLRKSLENSLSKSQFSTHPGDRARQEAIEEFAHGATDTIPEVIGIKILYTSGRGYVDLHRLGVKGGVHRYWADPSNAALILAYPKDRRGATNRKMPLLLSLRQNGAIVPKNGSRYFSPPNAPTLCGRMLGDKRNRQKHSEWQRRWKVDLEAYLSSCGLSEYRLVTQGCVVRYENGDERFIRNFTPGPKYKFKNSILKGVVGIRKSPLSHSVKPLIRLSTV